MKFDDRLATVLRTRAGSAASERTQLRQLLDLLGTASAGQAADAAYARLTDLRATIPADEQAAILREPGLRLRNPELVEYFATGDPKTAASAIATARLAEHEWEALIPRLPVMARGFLRHRRDLPAGAMRQLQQLGVGDLVLSDDRMLGSAQPVFADANLPTSTAIEQIARRTSHRIPTATPENAAPTRIMPFANPANEPIGDIIERIEQFRSARHIPVLSPRLPLGDASRTETAGIEAFDVVTDAQGVAIWASASVAPWIVGMALTGPRPGVLARLDNHAAEALRHRQPLYSHMLCLSGAAAIAGDWRIDAAPVFASDSGAFCGYRCRLLRAISAPSAADEPDSHEDKMRQVLHELRTPVNAIQGFAEIIQQQIFGPVPHEYRAHAAAIAMDAARLLAGFEDIERMARLESGVAELDEGESDFRRAVEQTLERLTRMLSGRSAKINPIFIGGDFAIALAPGDALALCWRLLANAAAALAPDEQIVLSLTSDSEEIRLELELPASLREPDAAGRTGPAARATVSAGMFGPQFAFRLAAAETRAAGGTLLFDAAQLNLTMPVLTAPGIAHSRRLEQPGG